MHACSIQNRHTFPIIFFAFKNDANATVFKIDFDLHFS
jgi:hypothetical protein